MDLLKVLRDSLLLLFRKPKVFIPKLFTTLLYTIYTLYSMRLAVGLYEATSRAEFEAVLYKVAVLLALTFILYLIDVVSYAMYPKIVADYRSGRSISLTDALRKALGMWKQMLILTVILFAFLLFTSLIAGVFNLLSILSGNLLFVSVAFVIVLAMVLAFAVLFFFTVPVVVLEGLPIKESLEKSFSMGLEHKGMLLKVNLLFMGLILATLWMVGMAELGGETSLAGAALFITVRLVQAVLNTYLNASNPYIYVSLTEGKDFNKQGDN